MIPEHRPELHRKFRDLAELIMRTKNYDAMLEYLGGIDAFNVIVSIPPDGPERLLTSDQLMACLNVGRLLPEHRKGKGVVDLLAA